MFGLKQCLTQDAGWAVDIGQRRTNNEDSVAALSVDLADGSGAQSVGLYAVGDGMGGHQGGEIASQLAVHTALRYFMDTLTKTSATTPELYQQWLKEAVEMANTAIFDEQDEALEGMGTTLVMAAIDGSRAYIANVGDSRAYHLASQGITQITQDHTLAQAMYEQGVLTAEEAARHRYRHVLRHAIGTEKTVHIDTFTVDMEDNDYLLLCSDGLTNELDDDTIDWIIRRTISPQAACDALIRAANAAGGQDNMGVVLVQLKQTQPKSSSWVLELINGN